MLGWFKARAVLRDTAKQLYGTSVTQARNETFYADWSVPDTLEGRFEMIVLHLFLVVERLQVEGDEGQELSRAILEAFVIDIDDHMREVGIADIKVPKHVKKAAAIAYDRFGDYGAAFKSSNDEAALKLIRAHIYGQAGADDTLSSDQLAHAPAILAYVRDTGWALAKHSKAQMLAGVFTFPLPQPLAGLSTKQA